MSDKIKSALLLWAENNLNEVSDEDLIELSILVNKEVQHRELAL